MLVGAGGDGGRLVEGRFWEVPGAAAGAGWSLRMEPGWVPPALLRWVANPAADEGLGTDILADLGSRAALFGYNC